MIALLLAKKIAELFCYLLIGFVMVRLRILKGEDTVPLSKLSLYLVNPCAIFHSFQIEATSDVLKGFVAAFVTAIILQMLFTLMAALYRRITHVALIDEAMIIYPNVGNLTIPLVASVLGAEWVVYVSAYIIVFNVMIWSRGIRMFTDDPSYRRPAKVLLNPNILACAAGAVCMLAGVRLGGIPQTVIATGASFVGPLTMLITGMVLATLSIKELFANRAVFGTILMRMVVCPLAVLPLLRAVSRLRPLPQANTLFMIVLLSAAGPAANMISQFAVLFDHDAKHASVVSTTTTLLCIATLPLMVYLYGL